MTCLVAYDVRSGLRLRRVAKVCLRFGVRVGLSVFEINVEDKRDFNNLREQLSREIDPNFDLIRIYCLCEECIRSRVVLGRSRGELPSRVPGEAFIF